jgi:hypothetical protein
VGSGQRPAHLDHHSLWAGGHHLRHRLGLLGRRQRRAGHRDAGQPQIDHYDGTGWSTVSSPTVKGPAPSNIVLEAVSCAGPHACWAVGGSEATPVIERLDSTGGWQIVAQPAADAGPLSGVACVTASDCWAVGDGVTDAPLMETDAPSA